MTVTVHQLGLYALAMMGLWVIPGPVWVALTARALSGGMAGAWPLAVGVERSGKTITTRYLAVIRAMSATKQPLRTQQTAPSGPSPSITRRGSCSTTWPT